MPSVGKTFTIGTMIVMLCILSDYPLKVLWTAHRSRTSDETFKFMCSLVRKPAIARYVDGESRRANGQQKIAFANGSRILFGARENGFGRGFDNVDVEVFNEAQILGTRVGRHDPHHERRTEPLDHLHGYSAQTK